MNAHAEEGHIAASPSTEGRGAIGRFFDTLIGTIFIVLLAAGLIALTSTWQSSDLLFEGSDRVLVTRDQLVGVAARGDGARGVPDRLLDHPQRERRSGSDAQPVHEAAQMMQCG